MRKEHLKTLKTLYDIGVISRHAMKSIRGQMLKMTDSECEEYLRKIQRRKHKAN